MKKKLFSVVALCVMMVSMFALVACAKKREEGPMPIIVDGFVVETVTVFHVQDNYYNLEIGLTNMNDEAKTFDFAEVVLKLGEVTLSHSGNRKEYASGEYYKWVFMIDYVDGIEVGKELDVFVGERKITTIMVEEF